MERLDRIESDISEIKKTLPGRPIEQLKVQPLPPKPAEKKIKPAVQSPSDASLESAIGTKWIGRIGMVAIIFGVAFFLKYSFDNKLIGETGRIILGIVSGIGFIGSGEYFQARKHWRIYGQILTGGGIAILYVSIYAAFAFYHLISQIMAFFSLLVITTTGITLSVRYSARSIAILGLLGGFLTPLMLSTGENRPISLFSYILLLDAGIMTVVYFKNWRSLGILSFIATITMYALWHDRFYTPDQRAIAFGVVTVFFIFYYLSVVLSKTVSRKNESYHDLSYIFAGAAFLLLAFYIQNDYQNNWTLKSFVLSVSILEVLLAGIVVMRAPEKTMTIHSFSGVSVIFHIIALFLIFERGWISAALAAEMAIFAFMGLRLKRIGLRVVSYALAVLVVVKFFYEAQLILGAFDRFVPVLNTRFLVCAFVIATFYIALTLLYRNKDRLLHDEGMVIPGMLIITQFVSLYLLSAETYDFYRYKAYGSYPALVDIRYALQLSLSVIWTLYAFALVSIGIIKKVRLLRILGIVLLAITIFKVFLIDLSELGTLYRIVSFVILGLVLLIVSYFYNRFKHRLFGEDRT